MFRTRLGKKRLIGLLLFAVILALFVSFNRFPKLEIVGDDLNAVNAPDVQCFQGFCIERELGISFWERWWVFSLTYLRLVSIGMVFAFAAAGLTQAFLFPQDNRVNLRSGGIFSRTIKGAALGPVMNLCSACIVPVSSAFQRKVGLEGAIAMVQGSATMNIPALAMVFFVFTPMLGFSRLILAVVGALIIGPIVVMSVRKQIEDPIDVPTITATDENDLKSDWMPVLREGLRDWVRSTFGYLIRLGPIMVVAGFASGLAIQWLSPETVSSYLGNNLWGVAIAATFGILINVPLLFEIPLVALLLLLGMGTAPAATLLFTAAAGGPVTFWGLAKLMPRRAIATFAGATWTLGCLGGVAVLGIGIFVWEDPVPHAPCGVWSQEQCVGTKLWEGSDFDSPLRVDPKSKSSGTVVSEIREESEIIDMPVPPYGGPVVPFREIARSSLGENRFVDNWLPGVALFDYDRDGDMDFFVSVGESGAVRRQVKGGPSMLFRNDGLEAFTEVGEEAGLSATKSNSSGVAACDFDNDGYQDLYVASYGRIGDDLDFRSIEDTPGLREVVSDRIYRNRRDGTFEDVTDTAFGDMVNLRSALSVACADVDSDGWLDIFVGNRVDDDFLSFSEPWHHGHYNVLYRNNGDFTFTDITETAGLLGPQIRLLSPNGAPVIYKDPATGAIYEGFNPAVRDKKGNLVGEPTGQTLASLFFDHDDDGDPDLWLADDGDRLKVYRNDSSPQKIRFTAIHESMGIDQNGAWMGFALGDFDSDADLDVFVTNIGFHPLLHEPLTVSSGDCGYSHRFDWSTCFHYLLRNDGSKELDGIGTIGLFTDIAGSTPIRPNSIMPSAGLNRRNILTHWEIPTGLSAYEFGFGAVFFDLENDGDQDLYWLGSMGGRGEGPFGQMYESAGRMLRGDGSGSFEDVTVESQLLDIARVDYSLLDSTNPEFDAEEQRLLPKFHENGKGVATGDLNGDGYPDLIATNAMGPTYVGPNLVDIFGGPLFVWLNGGGENHWLKLRLKGRMSIDGTGSNADGIGARVLVRAKVDGTNVKTQIQDVLGSSSFLSMSSLELNFGVGLADRVEEVEIRWPSGVVQVLRDVEINQLLEVIEPAS